MQPKARGPSLGARPLQDASRPQPTDPAAPTTHKLPGRRGRVGLGSRSWIGGGGARTGKFVSENYCDFVGFRFFFCGMYYINSGSFGKAAPACSLLVGPAHIERMER